MPVMIRFTTSTGVYAVPVADAIEVRARGDLRPLPAAAPDVEGVVERDGHVVTVVNTLGVGQGDARVLVLGTAAHPIGVLADGVDVLTVPDDAAGPTPAGQQGGLVRATIRHGDDLLFVVDVDELARQFAYDLEGSV